MGRDPAGATPGETRLQRAGRQLVGSVRDGARIAKRATQKYRQVGAPEGLQRRTKGNAIIYSGPQVLVVSHRDQPEPRRGVYLWGGCDLPSAFRLEPMLATEPVGTVAIGGPYMMSLVRCASAIALQSLDPPAVPAAGEARDRMGLPPDYFAPTLFEPRFQIGDGRLGSFPKSVVMLSLGGEIIRPLYRHREHDFVVDPGGNWLTAITSGRVDEGLVGRDQIAWFNQEFERLPRSSVDDFADRYRRLIPEVKRRTGAEVIVFNTLTVEPGDRTHNFQLRRTPESERRRGFHVALTELATEVGFTIIDVDRILKQHGVRQQLDFAHFPEILMKPVATELYGALRETGVV